MSSLQRGRVWAVLHEEIGRNPYLVVSNNRRNRNLPSVLAGRITTSHKPDVPSVVALGPGDPLVGSVFCDEVGPLWGDEVQADAGALSPGTIRTLLKPACVRPSDSHTDDAERHTHPGVGRLVSLPVMDMVCSRGG